MYYYTAIDNFPSLRNVDFIFTDENGAKLQEDILAEFVRINVRGVIIKIQTIPNLFDLCKI